MNILNLDEGTTQLRYTPIALSPVTGEWDSPREHSEFFDLRYLFPLSYLAGDIELQEGVSLAQAIRVVRSCQAYDGGGVVLAVVRPKQRGRKKPETSPWGRPPNPNSGEAVAVPESVTDMVNASTQI